MSDTSADVAWDAELADLLADLSATQDDLLAVLSAKRERLVSGKVEGIEEMHSREQEVLHRLQQCHDRRAALLGLAAQSGLPSDSIRSLASAVDGNGLGTVGNGQAGVDNLGEQVKDASAKMLLLRHQSLTNWVLAQRALVHLSQMIEIIATGGRMQPTYGNGAPSFATGNLVDHAV